MPFIVPTYSVSPGTSQEASSKASITDVLTVLLDNTSKEITPRDVRDAVFSAWESSVIRYTTDGTTPYIGIDRNDVKDVKLFLGKKEISGVTIMSSTLNSSDTDIFLYNTKSDSAVTQDFKMSILAGSSASLFGSAPYIGSRYISSSPSYLSLDIVNPATYGTINIESGSSASITLNNLQFPSPNYITDVTNNPSSASPSTTNDLFLVVRSGQSLELATYQSSGSSLGAPGVQTDIYGSPVNVNGNSLEYTNLNPTVTSIGGISIGSTFSNVALIDMISAILYPYLEPTAILQIVNTSQGSLSYNNTLERIHTGSPAITIYYTYTLTKRTYDITSTNFSLFRNSTSFAPGGGWPSTTLSGSGLISQTYTGNSVGIAGSGISAYTGKSVFTFSLSPFDGTGSSTASTYFEVVYPYFYGFSSTSSSTDITINTYAMNETSKRVDTFGSQSLAINGTGYLHFIYPSSYGTISSIKDGNDFTEYTHNSVGIWTYSQNFLDSPDSYWNNGSFYVYRKTLSTTIPPSQIYKFNF
jgi:hypothetical protein